MAKKKKSKPALPDFNKYVYYEKSVQSADTDVRFFRKVFKKHTGRSAVTMREDFCGTHMLSCEWVKLDPSHIAHGVDLDAEPIVYGQKNHAKQLKSEQQERIIIHQANVMDKNLPKTDLALACNFSYYLFKKRETLVAYFKNAYEHLNKDGMFILDCFGGSQCQEKNEEETKHSGFSYFWDQTNFNPITSEALFYIHFQRKGEKKRERCFTYDWRMWSITEIRECLSEAGFKKSTVYWEGTTKSGDGDGNFTPSTKGEECAAWIAYIMAEN